MDPRNPFEPLASPRGDATVRPFLAVDVMRAGGRALLGPSSLGVVAVGVAGYAAFVAGLCCCAVPGFVVGPLALASELGALLAAVDGRSVFERWLEPYRQWRAMWGPGVVLVLVYTVAMVALFVPVMIAQLALGKAALVLSLPLQLVFQPLTTAWLLAGFAWVEGTTDPIGALQRGWAVVRDNLGETVKVAAVVGGIGAVLGLPAQLFQPDLAAMMADPVGYQPPIPTWMTYVLLIPTVIVGLWGALTTAAIHRTQAPRAEAERAAG